MNLASRMWAQLRPVIVTLGCPRAGWSPKSGSKKMVNITERISKDWRTFLTINSLENFHLLGFPISGGHSSADELENLIYQYNRECYNKDKEPLVEVERHNAED